jgi:hypothetical protein
MNSSEPVLRPRQFAVLLLGSGESLPRARARDQQGDLAGSRLKRTVLQHLLERDPEPAALESCLQQIVADLGAPSGPTRAMARLIAEEWEATRQDPSLTAWLLDQAVRDSADVRT